MSSSTIKKLLKGSLLDCLRNVDSFPYETQKHHCSVYKNDVQEQTCRSYVTDIAITFAKESGEGRLTQ